MFDRFRDAARSSMGLARQEAQRLDHDYVGTEHLLLGIVAEGSGVGATVLRELGIGIEKARRAVEARVPRGEKPQPTGQLPFTPRAKRALELSLEAASELHHDYIGTPHLLLGLVRVEEGVAAGVLRDFGVNRDDVLRRVVAALDSEVGRREAAVKAGGGEPTPVTFGWSPWFSERVVRSIATAYSVSFEHRSDLTPAHMLLGVVQSLRGVPTPGRDDDFARCLGSTYARVARKSPEGRASFARVEFVPESLATLAGAFARAAKRGASCVDLDDLGEELVAAGVAGEEAETIRRWLAEYRKRLGR